MKGLLCSFLSISMMAQYCLPVLAEDNEETVETTNQEDIEASNEEETLP